MRIWLAGAALLLVAARVSAQDAVMQRRFEQVFQEVQDSYFETRGGMTLSEYGRLLYGAYTTWSLTNFDDESADNRMLLQWDSKLWAQGSMGGHTLYGRLRLRYQDYDSTFTQDDGLSNPLSDRYWYRYDWRKDRRARAGEDPSWDWWVQAGRQYVSWVSGITLSETLYAARAGFEAGLWRVEGLVGWTPDSFIDFDGSRPGFDSDTDRLFWGVSVEYHGLAAHRPFVYFLQQNDENDTELPGGARWQYDSWYVGLGSTGQVITGAWLYRAEFIYEGGRSISDIGGVFPQTIDDVTAWAARFQLSYMPPRFRDTRGLRYELEVLFGSGDPDRGHSAQTVGGNLAGTDDKSFNAFGYVNTGLALAPELANLFSLRLGASTIPWSGQGGVLERLRFQVNGFLFAKLDGDAPMSVLTVPGESYVGAEADFIVEWILTSDTALNIQYGLFIPGNAIPDNDLRQYLYVGFSYGF